jgi:enolase
MNIKSIHGRQILDSRGNPTVEADVTLESGAAGRAAVPSGASVGIHEAVELRDEDKFRFAGKGVLKAVANVNGEIAGALVGVDASDQRKLDERLIKLDGMANKGRLGANAILSVSIAAAKAEAAEGKQPLYKYFAKLAGNNEPNLLPMPMMNIINGGKHAEHSTDIQEFMIVPVGARTFSDAVRMGVEIFHTLGKVLDESGYGTTVGDEGGYAPTVKNGNQEALNLIDVAVQRSGYKLGDEVELALDLAASEFREGSEYNLAMERRKLSSDGMIAWVDELRQKYPVVSVEDGLAQDDWEGWKELMHRLGDKMQVVGDDFLMTNVEFLKKAIQERAANAILVKLNQVGTLSETIDAVKLAQENGWKAIISNRSGETEDVTISHLAVGLGTGQIKIGSLSRTDRTAKYNELLRIEEEQDGMARFAGREDLNLRI